MSSVDNQTTDDQSLSPPPLLTARRDSIVQRITQVVRRKSSVSHTARPLLTRTTSASNSDATTSENGVIGKFSLIVTNDPADYDIGSAIGYGSSATVHSAMFKPQNRMVAIKMIELELFGRNQIDELRRELQIMTLSRHENLLPVYGSFVAGSKLHIVTPLLASGSCLNLLRNGFEEGLDESAIATILKQCLLGLDYLHKNNLIHRDVKAGNLLIDDDGEVLLADFGVSSSLMEGGERKNHRRTFVGTPCWMAPEMVSAEQRGYDYKADIWSLGITAIELATGSAPYARFPPLKVLMLTLSQDPPRLPQTKKFSRSFRDFVDSCLQKDPTKRPTAEKLLNHPFIRSARKPESLVTSVLAKCAPVISRTLTRGKTSTGAPDNQSAERVISWDFSNQSIELSKNAGAFSRSSTSTTQQSSSSRSAPVSPVCSHLSGPLSAPLQPAAESPPPVTTKGRFELNSPVGRSGSEILPSPPSSSSPSPIISSSGYQRARAYSECSVSSVQSSRRGRFFVEENSPASPPTASRHRRTVSAETVTTSATEPPSLLQSITESAAEYEQSDRRNRRSIRLGSLTSDGNTSTNLTSATTASVGSSLLLFDAEIPTMELEELRSSVVAHRQAVDQILNAETVTDGEKQQLLSTMARLEDRIGWFIGKLYDLVPQNP